MKPPCWGKGEFAIWARPSFFVGLAVFGLLILGSLTSGCSSAGSVSVNRSGNSQVSIIGSGKLVTREVDASDFSGLEIGSALKVDITQGTPFKVVVTADDNVIDYVEANRTGQVLTLGVKSGSYTNTTIRVAVTMPDMTRVSLSGASKATMSGFKPGALEVRLSGASQLTGRVEAGSLDAAVAEASKLELGGSAGNLKLSQTGASQAALGDLGVEDASIQMKEASNGTVNVKDRLDADLRSASNLYYVGNPSLGSITSVEASSLRRK